MALNLHAMVSGLIGSVNAFIPATIRRSNGYTIAPGGVQVPTYIDTPLMIQVQPLSTGDLQKLQNDGLNLQSNPTGVYLSGDWNGVVRAGKQGGDLLVFNNQTWLVTNVLEGWDGAGWTKLAVTMQMDGK
jgi:hypothetical protein